ncbi:hypothetical protein [Novosphingobium sp.]|uniref:hypothetical protein n=1 Tax=Novosphingobium sp. TaxID=1874826 RepID=UPI003561A42E
MFHSAITSGAKSQTGEMAALLDMLAHTSTRPRYAFMVLSLIAEVANADGEAGPFIKRDRQQHSLRDWLCDSLAPMGGRDPRRIALAARVEADLAAAGALPTDPRQYAAVVERELRDRIRASGKTNLSRAVSELVGAGLLRRYYAGYAVDHPNRGGQRNAVYVLQGLARCLLPRNAPPRPVPMRPRPVQGELRLF